MENFPKSDIRSTINCKNKFKITVAQVSIKHSVFEKHFKLLTVKQMQIHMLKTSIRATSESTAVSEVIAKVIKPKTALSSGSNLKKVLHDERITFAYRAGKSKEQIVPIKEKLTFAYEYILKTIKKEANNE